VYEITISSLLLFLLVLGGWIFDRWQRRRRGMRVRAVGFPLRWVPLVERGLPIYRSLPHDLREALQEKAFFKINDLAITGPGGVDEVTDEMRVSLGVHIGLLQARRRIPPVPSVRQVVVGSAAALAAAENSSEPPWGPGTLLAVWESSVGAARCFREEKDGNLMAHWHRLGGAGPGGVSADCDPLPDEHLYFAGWAASLWTDLPECRTAALAHAPELEGDEALFAAATEAFLRRPGALRAVAPRLFTALTYFYLYDSSRWNRDGRDAAAGAASAGAPLRPAAAARG